MKKGAGSRKGSSFERQICKQLSLWVSHGKRKDLFWRSPASGGRATVFKKRGEDLKSQAGDIVAVHPEGHALTKRFFIETKHYTDLQIGSFFLKQKGSLYKFWQKASRQAGAHNLKPLMIAKQNNMPTMLIVRQGDLFDICRIEKESICISSLKLPDVYLFDEVMKTKFHIQRYGSTT